VSEALIRIAEEIEHPRLIDLYLRWGYRAGIASADIVYVAEQDELIVGLVRRTFENDTTMLRGMHIDPAYQRRGIGTRLLQRFVADLPALDCYCIPYSHLTFFYGQAGFKVSAGDASPQFLIDRSNQYRLEGLDVLIMCRVADRRRRPPRPAAPKIYLRIAVHR
jgi:GNAT superfamily N-acetyltransferase